MLYVFLEICDALMLFISVNISFLITVEILSGYISFYGKRYMIDEKGHYIVSDMMFFFIFQKSSKSFKKSQNFLKLVNITWRFVADLLHPFVIIDN